MTEGAMEDWFGTEPADDAVSAESVAAVDAGDDLWIYDDGQLWDLGPPDLDADADGVPDSILTDIAGDPAILTDTDRDGQVDRVTRLETAGGVTVTAESDEPLPWRPTSLGRLP
ncbi:hypothetical protein L5G28_04075 [Gordonia sp. HY285]|uniref:DUF6802 domain-containing protein n=1 Tax=Gordonia liuliyuniae TaxID=2911517 RepID=A0ABS9IT82_9ACTN|nr:DUF6802 family protein [Gordonia liuliyuniae]MCF8588781.1 hypothetical protein [Gordonia liuliyuniae]MCF8609339.1 hypothetical protein [Gordonia liuliyuniae]